MKTEKSDRRSLRTRRLLGDALMSLLLERRYDDITVQDLLNRADVGRSTFYAHYYDKDDLLASEVERMLDALDRQMVASARGQTGLLPMLGLFQHVEEFFSVYRALGRGQELDIALVAMRKRLSEVVERRLVALASTKLPAITVSVTAQAVVGAVLSLLQWWVEAGVPVSAEQMEQYYRDIVLPGVHQLLTATSTSDRAGAMSN